MISHTGTETRLRLLWEAAVRNFPQCAKADGAINWFQFNLLSQLHQQGQQIERTHLIAVDIDHELSQSEKLLGKLGGIFSLKLKPQKNRPIQGPMLARGSHMEQRQRLGLTDNKTRSNPRQLPTEPASALEKVEVKKMKQDDGLDGLSNILGKLKEMAQDMGRISSGVGNL